MKVFLTTILVGLMASLSTVNAAAPDKHDVAYDAKHVKHHDGKESRDTYPSNDVEARDIREDYYGSDHYGTGKRDPNNDSPQRDNVTSHPQKTPNTTLKPTLQLKGEPRIARKTIVLPSLLLNSMFPFLLPCFVPRHLYAQF